MARPRLRDRGQHLRDWTFQPADFVAAYGLHAALVVGDPRPVDAASIPALVAERAAHLVEHLFPDVPARQ